MTRPQSRAYGASGGHMSREISETFVRSRFTVKPSTRPNTRTRPASVSGHRPGSLGRNRPITSHTKSAGHIGTGAKYFIASNKARFVRPGTVPNGFGKKRINDKYAKRVVVPKSVCAFERDYYYKYHNANGANTAVGASSAPQPSSSPTQDGNEHEDVDELNEDSDSSDESTEFPNFEMNTKNSPRPQSKTTQLLHDQMVLKFHQNRTTTQQMKVSALRTGLDGDLADNYGKNPALSHDPYKDPPMEANYRRHTCEHEGDPYQEAFRNQQRQFHLRGPSVFGGRDTLRIAAAQSNLSDHTGEPHDTSNIYAPTFRPEYVKQGWSVDHGDKLQTELNPRKTYLVNDINRLSYITPATSQGTSHMDFTPNMFNSAQLPNNRRAWSSSGNHHASMMHQARQSRRGQIHKTMAPKTSPTSLSSPSVGVHAQSQQKEAQNSPPSRGRLVASHSTPTL